MKHRLHRFYRNIRNRPVCLLVTLVTQSASRRSIAKILQRPLGFAELVITVDI